MRRIVQATVNNTPEFRVYENQELIARFTHKQDAEEFAMSRIYITKKYHFYSAHRNQNLDDKCFNLHGHLYRLEVTLSFPVPEDGISMLFKDIDKIVEPKIKAVDHKWIVDKNDPLYQDIKELLSQHSISVYEVPFVTSVENLCKYFYSLFYEAGLPVSKIAIQETESSIVTYEP